MTSRRWARTAAVGLAASTTAVALLGGLGVVQVGADVGAAERAPTAVLAAGDTARDAVPDRQAEPRDRPAREPRTEPRPEPRTEDQEFPGPSTSDDTVPAPAGSGTGRRVVLDQRSQRVWLIGSAERVRRTYPVSGSLEADPAPGRYEVLSRRAEIGSEQTVLARWFVRFAETSGGRRLGFHSIPLDGGRRVQRVRDLGTATSRGSVRQATPDALALWDFARVGTPVVVVG